MDYYYTVLGLNPGASKDEIRRAYRRLARKYHPDVSVEQNAEQRFIEINEAYEYLTEERPIQYTEFATAYEPAVDKEEQRRERARQYAEMKRERFRKEVLAFKSAWYFMPLKILNYSGIVILYIVGGLLISSPLFVWMKTGRIDATVVSSLLTVTCVPFFQLARIVNKTTKPYFDN